MDDVEKQGHKRARDAITRKTGEREKALELLDASLAQAIRENQSDSIRLIAGHAEVVAHAAGDIRRVIRYHEQRLNHGSDHSFALYNHVQLLLRAGELDLAKQCATKSYALCTAQDSEAERELAAVILTQWPDIEKGHA